MQFERFKSYITAYLKEHLPDDLTYHNLDHVLYVYDAAERIAAHEKITGDEADILRTSVLLHDAGFTRTYHQHEEAGCIIARDLLPDFGYSASQIDLICRMIMTTKIPQSASTMLEQALCDADLDYLGTDDFFRIGNGLFLEFLKTNVVKDEQGWNRLQVKFLEAHTYFTSYSRSNREEKKRDNLRLVIEIVNGYDTN